MTLTPLLLLLLGCPRAPSSVSTPAAQSQAWLITPEEAALPSMDATESAPEMNNLEGTEAWGDDGEDSWGSGDDDWGDGGLGSSGTGAGGGGAGSGSGLGVSSALAPPAPSGPVIQLDAPRAHVTTSPVRLKVSLAPGDDGVDVERSSLRVTYLRGWGVNITSRVLPYATDTGFDYPGAPMPPGDHAFEIYVENVAGNATTQRIDLSVR